MVDEAETIEENERAYIEHIVAKHEFAEANSKLIKAQLENGEVTQHEAEKELEEEAKEQMDAAEKEKPSYLDKQEGSEKLEKLKSAEGKKEAKKIEKEMKEAKKELEKDKEAKEELEEKKKAMALSQGPEYNVAHHDMYPGPDGYNFDFDKNLRGDTLRVTPIHA